MKAHYDSLFFESDRIGAYLINLDRAEERLNFVMPAISSLGLPTERISAIDGQTLSPLEIESVTDIENYKKFFKMQPEVGTIGCSLSHEKAWRRFLESTNEFAIIFEDDVQFHSAELRETVEFAIEKKTLWDIVNFETKHGGCPVKVTELCNRKHLVFYLTNVTHAGCYLINRRAACQLLNNFYPIKMPLDHYLTTSWELNLKFVGVEPRIVFQRLGDSQIKTSPPQKIKTMETLISNAIHNIQRAVFHFAHNLGCFISCKISRK